MASPSHNSPALCLLVAVTALGTAAAASDIPAPPWAARGTGPTSKLEVVTYAAQVRPLLPEDLRAKLDAASNAAPAEIVGLLYEARLRPAVTRSTTSTLGITNAPQPIAPTNNPVAEALLRVKPYVLPTAATVTSHSTVDPWDMRQTTGTNRIADIKSSYGDQWSILNGSPDDAWHGLPDVALYTRAVAQLEEIEKRLRNADDGLAGLQAYTNVFLVEGAAMSLFWHGYRLSQVERNNDRAEPILRLLVNNANRNSFTKGNAHRFLGKLLHARGQTDEALRHLLMVHRHAACLVFTANAYLEAARIFRDRYDYDKALAFLAIDVPTVELAQIRLDRYADAAYMCEERGEVTNAFRLLQAALVAWPEGSVVVTTALQNFATRRPELNVKAMWNAVTADPWSDKDVLAAIGKAVQNLPPSSDSDLIIDALAHEWPAFDTMPDNVRTNRLLNNNIFPQKKRASISSTNKPEQRR